ncbi:MAG: MBL fold metallo-hydrolase [Parachlamydiales bacterium]|nr:MBL fold metallo-hydrolase [Parachlamydiales bacterium]
MIAFCPLASGSKGNCLYLGNEQKKILIDAGISAKQIETRLQQIGVSIADIDAILVTHEHMDHIQGLKILCKRYAIPVFANSETAKGIYRNLQFMPKFTLFTSDESFSFGEMLIHPFSIQHDTLDPVGFIISLLQKKIGVCADLGYVTAHVKKNLEQCDVLYLEANHQESMVFSSARSPHYKKRVIGKQGHLSNQECAELLSSVYHEGLRHVYLAHLSSECNSEEAALKTVLEFVDKKIDISIAYQDKISKIIYL